MRKTGIVPQEEVPVMVDLQRRPIFILLSSQCPNHGFNCALKRSEHSICAI